MRIHSQQFQLFTRNNKVFLIINMKKMTLLFCVLSFFTATGQLTMTVEDAVKMAMAHNPQAKASHLQTERYQLLERSAINIPNPAIMLESTNAENYTLGINQTIDFPTVYAKQHRIAQQQTKLSKINNLITHAQVEAEIRTAYLWAQYTSALVESLTQRDTLYAFIEHAAQRKYAAGEIDALSASYAEMQHAEIHRTMMEAKADKQAAIDLLRLWTGYNEPFVTEELQELHPPEMLLLSDSIVAQQSLRYQYATKNRELSQQQLSLERHKLLPGLALGYLNPGNESTPVAMRLQFGVTLPLWWWQYSSNINAAKKQIEIAEQETQEEELNLLLAIRRLQSEYKKYKSSNSYYQNQGNELMQTMTRNSQRLFDVGSIDYITHMRNLNDAFTLEYRKLETLYQLNATLIQIQSIAHP